MLYIVIAHLIIFQGIFLVKNLITSKKIRATVRGKNIEATISISVFIINFVAVLLTLYFKPKQF